MSFLEYLVPPSLRWKLRRFILPIDSNALVLEVGSGGNPYLRSNILLDKYIESSQRHFQPLIVDRPCFICDAQRLPFKDKVFDFVIAAHILEHVENPDQFLSELQRVAKSGYIEVPNVVFERLNPYHDHLNEVSLSKGGTLLVRKKVIPIPDPFLVDEYLRTSHQSILKLIKKNPFDFHIRLFWKDSIDFTLCQPCTIQSYQNTDAFREFSLNKALPISNEKVKTNLYLLARSCIQLALALLFHKPYNYKNLSTKQTSLLSSLLQCSSCNSISFDILNGLCVCKECNESFSLFGLN